GRTENDRAPLCTSIRSSPSRGPPRSVRLRSDQSNGVGRCSVSLPAAELSIQTSPCTPGSVQVLQRCVLTVLFGSLVLIAFADLLGGRGPRCEFVADASGKGGTFLHYAVELTRDDEESNGDDEQDAGEQSEITAGAERFVQTREKTVEDIAEEDRQQE